MRKFKLTDQNMQTHNGYQWELGVWHEATGNTTQDLCSDAWLHCYDSPLLAVLHNPIHANIVKPRLFEVEVDGNCKQDNQLKCGYRRMKLVRELLLPEITTEQHVRYAILCTLKGYHNSKFVQWANAWLSGKDRSAEAAMRAAVRAAIAVEAKVAEAAKAAKAAGWAAEAVKAAVRWAVRWAVKAEAVRAAKAAVRAAEAAEAAEAARRAAEAAEAAVRAAVRAAEAAEAAGWAARWAAIAVEAKVAKAAKAAVRAAEAAEAAVRAARWVKKNIDLQALAEQAVAE